MSPHSSSSSSRFKSTLIDRDLTDWLSDWRTICVCFVSKHLCVFSDCLCVSPCAFRNVSLCLSNPAVHRDRHFQFYFPLLLFYWWSQTTHVRWFHRREHNRTLKAARRTCVLVVQCLPPTIQWQVTVAPGHYRPVTVDRRQDTYFKIRRKRGSYVCVCVCHSFQHSSSTWWGLTSIPRLLCVSLNACLLLSISDLPPLKWSNTFSTLNICQRQYVPLRIAKQSLFLTRGLCSQAIFLPVCRQSICRIKLQLPKWLWVSVWEKSEKPASFILRFVTRLACWAHFVRGRKDKWSQKD